MAHHLTLSCNPRDAVARRAIDWWLAGRPTPRATLEASVVATLGNGADQRPVHIAAVGAQEAGTVLQVDRGGGLYQPGAPQAFASLTALGPPPPGRDPAALAPLLVQVVYEKARAEGFEDALFSLLVDPLDTPGAVGPGLALRLYSPQQWTDLLTTQASDDDWGIDIARSLVVVVGDIQVDTSCRPWWVVRLEQARAFQVAELVARAALQQEGLKAIGVEIVHDDTAQGEAFASQMRERLHQGAVPCTFGDPLPDLLLWVQGQGSTPSREAQARLEVAQRQAATIVRVAPPSHAAERIAVIRGAHHDSFAATGDPECPTDTLGLDEGRCGGSLGEPRPWPPRSGFVQPSIRTLLELGVQDAGVQPEQALQQALVAWLRAWGARAALHRLRTTVALPGRMRLLPRAPGPLALRSDDHIVVHPEPPLPPADADLLRRLNPRARPETPTTLLAWQARGQARLPTGQLALSLSEPPRPPLPGQSPHHLLTLVIHVARGVLAGGMQLSFDGALKPPDTSGGRTGTSQPHDQHHWFTPRLGAAVRYWSRQYHRAGPAVFCRAPWLDPPTEVAPGVEVEVVSPQGVRRLKSPRSELNEAPWSDLQQAVALAAGQEPPGEHKVMLARTLVRLEQARVCAARVLIAGNTNLRPGMEIPGVLEELWWSLQQRTGANPHPIYIVGGLGGAAALVARAACGDVVPAAAPGERYAPGDLAELLPTYDGLLATLRDLGRELGWTPAAPPEDADDANQAFNGLLREENLRLLHSTDPVEVTALILRGLRQVQARREGGGKVCYRLLDAGPLAANTDGWLVDAGESALLACLGVPNPSQSSLAGVEVAARLNARPVIWVRGTSSEALEQALALVAAQGLRILALDEALWSSIPSKSRTELERICPRLVVTCADPTRFAPMVGAVGSHARAIDADFKQSRPQAAAQPVLLHLRREEDQTWLIRLGTTRAATAERAGRGTCAHNRYGLMPMSSEVCDMGWELWNTLCPDPDIAQTTDLPVAVAHDEDGAEIALETLRDTPTPWTGRDSMRQTLSLRRPMVRQLISDGGARRPGVLGRRPGALRALVFCPTTQIVETGTPSEKAEAAIYAELQKQVSAIDSALTSTGFVEVKRVGNLSELEKQLAAPWDIIHLTTHGGREGELLGSGWLSVPHSIRLLTGAEVRRAAWAPTFVFLNACFGATMKPLVSTPASVSSDPLQPGSTSQPRSVARCYAEIGCEALFGPVMPVMPEAAGIMAVELYRHWVRGAPLERAVLEARRTLVNSDLRPVWQHYVQYGGVGLTLRGMAGR